MRLFASCLLSGLAAISLAACDRLGSDPEASNGRPSAAPVRAEATPPPILTPAMIEQAMPSEQSTPQADPAATDPATGADGQGTPALADRPDAAMVRLQILLDRSPFSPGIIDGLNGENVRQAIVAFRKANDLGEGDTVDAALFQALTAGDGAPVMTQYVLTQADVSGPFSPPPGDDMAAQAEAGTHYSTALERMAERFHMSEALLQGLNPGVDFRTAGQTLVVPALRDTPLPEVARIEVSASEKTLRAYDASDKLIAFYPATIGSSDNRSPSGSMTVNGVAPEPDYLYDPSRLSFGPGGDKITIPAGPNNPVGSVWIDLSRDTYGIHGTPDPSKIGKTASHGCIRLTNWDAEQLAAAVKPGVKVTIG